jgi:transposase
METRKPYPSDVSDEEWFFVAPYLALVREDASQRTYNLREAFNALRWIVRAGASWRMLPHDLPPWEAVYQQTQGWLSPPESLRRWSTTSEPCYAWPPAARPTLRPQSSTVELCALRPRAATAQATTEPNASVARRCTRQ